MNFVLIFLIFFKVSVWSCEGHHCLKKEANPLKNTAYSLMDRASSSIIITASSLICGEMIEILNQRAREGIRIEIAIEKRFYQTLKAKMHPSIKISECSLEQQQSLIVDESYVWLSAAGIVNAFSSKSLSIGFYSPSLASTLLKQTNSH